MLGLSDRLDSEAIVEFVKALCTTAQEELAPVKAPRVYSLTKIVEISHFNIDDPPRMYNDYTAKTRPKSPASFEPANKPDYDGDYVGKDDFVIKRSDSHNLHRPETVETEWNMCFGSIVKFGANK